MSKRTILITTAFAVSAVAAAAGIRAAKRKGLNAHDSRLWLEDGAFQLADNTAEVVASVADRVRSFASPVVRRAGSALTSTRSAVLSRSHAGAAS